MIFNEEELIEIYNHIPQILRSKIITVTIPEEFFLRSNSEEKNILLKPANNGDYWIFGINQDQGLLFPKPNRKINGYEYKTLQKLFDCEGYKDSETKTFTVKKPAEVTIILTITKKKYKLQNKGILDFIPTSPLSQLELDLSEAQEKNRQLQLKLSESEQKREQIASKLAQLQERYQLIFSELESNKNFSKKAFQLLENRDEFLRKFQSLLENQTNISNSNSDIINSNLSNLNQRLHQIEDGLKLQQKERSHLEETLKIEQVKNSELEQAKRNLGLEIKELSEELKSKNVSSNKQKKLKNYLEMLPKEIKLEMIAIPAGEFLMGTDDAEIERLCSKYNVDWFKWEAPQHRVTIKPFYMGKYPITQAQYQAIMGKNPSTFKGENNPVECVSWNDAQEFCQKLSEKTGKEYKLPSETQWEYACRAGSQTKYYFGDDENQLKQYAWYKNNSENKTHPVGEKKPNKWGLYDMHGNVWEWCEDDFVDNYRYTPIDSNSYISQNMKYKILRGGSWYYNSFGCRSAFRDNDFARNFFNDVGFRVMCVSS